MTLFLAKHKIISCESSTENRNLHGRQGLGKRQSVSARLLSVLSMILVLFLLESCIRKCPGSLTSEQLEAVGNAYCEIGPNFSNICYNQYYGDLQQRNDLNFIEIVYPFGKFFPHRPFCVVPV